TGVAITKIDALFPEVRGLRDRSKLPRSVREWVEKVESTLKVPVKLLGTGEDVEDAIYLGDED
ncbi:MAG: adenylosuccinate synthetase, partial [Sulfolobales archaeon]